MAQIHKDTRNRWGGAWPDALAFVAGLGLAWQFQWETSDLVWSLWLSSLVIGYAMIVWGLFGSEIYGGVKAWTGRAAFFPVDPVAAQSFPGPALYGEVFQRYGWFLPAAAIAERAAFRLTPAGPAATSVTPEPGADRKIRKSKTAFDSGGMMAPYKNVIRLHLLIFFFAFAHFARLDNFLVYAVVSAVYFFPWRLLKREEAR